MKGCICHFVNWQIHPFIFKVTNCLAYNIIRTTGIYLYSALQSQNTVTADLKSEQLLTKGGDYLLDSTMYYNYNCLFNIALSTYS